jgi:hypothetical protein
MSDTKSFLRSCSSTARSTTIHGKGLNEKRMAWCYGPWKDMLSEESGYDI